MTEKERSEIIEKLKSHANAFEHSGLCSYSGYFPNDFYGNQADRYYLWGQRAYRIIRQLDDVDAP